MNSTTDGNKTTDNVDLTKPKVNLIEAPTERDIDEILHNYCGASKTQYLDGDFVLPEVIEAHFKQAIEAHYKAKFEKLIESAKPQRMKPERYDAVLIAVCESYNRAIEIYEANLREKLKGR